ncbi:MAG: alpha/beta hydrolase [Beijerinckiaceae bacterium]|jgi:pimeloyl-ACP methyl ester carboxylesterase|nr:alpha/beta hydrolase [Beijerinckiaceae bacterium]
MTSATSRSPADRTGLQRIYRGADGGRLVATVHGHAERSALLLHGGGQTRHAWRKTGLALAHSWQVIALDQRGHGASDWANDGAYAFPDFARDARAVARQIADRTGLKPVVIGASLGGIAALLALDDPADPPFSALCMVDIVPQMNPAGVDTIQGFMRARAAEGFASVEEAADAVAAYLPHRPRPASLDGLRRNLRHDPDGRWRWHWDPRFLDGPRSVNAEWDAVRDTLMRQAALLAIPGLLVRGAFSELVTDEAAQEFLGVARTMTSVDVAKARHMVAGDSNDDFIAAISAFLATITPLPARATP